MIASAVAAIVTVGIAVLTFSSASLIASLVGGLACGTTGGLAFFAYVEGLIIDPYAKGLEGLSSSHPANGGKSYGYDFGYGYDAKGLVRFVILPQ